MQETIPPFLQNLPAAYQLHYHLGLATLRKQPLFASATDKALVSEVLAQVCEKNHYHLLNRALSDNGLYLLLSLRPEHSVSEVVKSIKGNIWAARRRAGDPQRVWSRGLFVRSVGSVSAEQISNYVASQFEHHEVSPTAYAQVSYLGDLSALSKLRTNEHAAFEMNHHFVFAVHRRETFLEPEVARGLLECLRETAAREDIVVWRIEIVPEHAHLLLGLKPSQAPAEVASRLLADAWRWMTARYGAALRSEELENVWKLGYYVGTAGAATTAQVRVWLSARGVAQT